MLRTFICWLFLVCSGAAMALTSTESGYTIYSDSQGNIYLMAPKQFVLVRKSTSIPLSVLPKNGLLKVYQTNSGSWDLVPLTQAQWDALSLTLGSDQVRDLQLGDMDGDGSIDALLVLNNQQTPYLKLENLTGDATLFAATGYSVADATRNWRLEDNDGDGVYDINSDDVMVMSRTASASLMSASLYSAPELVPSLSAGEFRVDESGSANYSIPLNIPAGRAGVKPTLGLAYNSNAGEGYLGVGWSLEGASAIGRCPKNIATDGTQGRIGFNTSDRLCLDGQRLMTASGTTDSLYWTSGASYYKELTDFSIVRSHGTTTQGPRAFTVETKSGEIHYYGDVSAVSGTDSMGKSLALSLKVVGGAAESSTDALFEVSSTNNTPRNWALKAIKDVKGNYIVFRYAKDMTIGEQYLTEVHYTGSTSLAPFAKVVFNYVPNKKPKRGYFAGVGTGFTKRLDSVTAFQDGQEYRHYVLAYDESHVTEERTHLLSVQECTTSAAALCIPATTFDWHKPAPVSTSSSLVCAVGDPSDCWEEESVDNYTPFNSTSTTVGTTNADTGYQQLIDFNGDGYTDQVFIEGGLWKVRFGNSSFGFGAAVTMTSQGVAGKDYVRTIDYNGDGQRDLLVADSDTANWQIISYEKSTATSQQCEPSGGGTLLCEPVTVNRNYKVTNVGFPATGRVKGAWVADFDGDGMEDIVFLSNGVFGVYRNKGVTVNGGGTPDTFLGFESLSNVGDISDMTSLDEQYGLVTVQNVSGREASAIDINGDGRTDILVKISKGSCSIGGFDTAGECRYEGGTWSTTSEWRIYSSNGTALSLAWSMNTVSGMANMRPVDLNGDGYTDLMYQIGTTWYYRISNGITLQAQRSSYLTTTTALAPETFFLDVNQDGTTDLLLPTSTTNWAIYLTRPTMDEGEINFESRGNRSRDAYAYVQFADLNGDGLLDLLTSTDSNGWKLFTNKRTGYHDHVIYQITNGWGVPTQIFYRNLSDTAVYYRATSSQRISSDYLPGSPNYYVVEQVNTEVGSGNVIGVGYQYGGLMLHKKGRGMLGFETLRTTDLQSNVVTETTYHQVYPLTGRPKTTTQVRNNVLLSFATTTWSSQAATQGGTFVFASASTEKAYQIHSDLLSNTQINQTTSSFAYDGYGNLTSSTVTVSDPANVNNKLETLTTNTFNASTLYQRYGRLTASTVTKKLYRNSTTASDIKTRQSSFTYNSDLMLQNEVTAPDFAAATQTKVTTYDSFGNAIQVSVTAATGANGATPATRTASTGFTTDGRFVATQTDALGNVTTLKYNGLAAATFAASPTLITSMTTVNPNGLSSTKTFDAFGEGLSEAVKGALAGDLSVGGSTQKAFCSGCESNFPNAYVVVTSTTDTGALSYRYLDKYGREVGSKSLLLESTKYGYKKIDYDAQGRPFKTYEPSVNGLSSYFSTATFDAMGRLVSTTAPNYSVATTSVSGYTETSTDGLNKTSSKTSNYLGQTASTTDHNGKVLSYTYNANGDLEKVTSAGIDRIINTFDAYGRKTAMLDVDKGSWSYVTNGFGEVISQTDAKSQTVSSTYDGAGRLVRQYDPSGTICWSYGTSAAAYNIGQVVSVKQWTGNELCTTATTPVYQESFTYTSKSLPSTKVVTMGGVSYTTSTTFDDKGRPYDVTYPTVAGVSGIVVRHHYATNGELYQLTDTAGAVYQKYTGLNSRGSVNSVQYGSVVSMTQTMDAATGWVTGLSATAGSTSIETQSMSYDVVGNLTSRSISFGLGNTANLTESFTYDNLHRVLSRTVNTFANVSGSVTLSESYAYDDNGNLTSKGNVGYYQYNVTGKPNRLAAIWQNSNFTGTQNYAFSYDANGNVLSDSKRSYTYTSFDKPSLITQGADTTSFSYGPSRQLIKRVDDRGGQKTSTVMVDGLYEQVTLPSGVVEHKYFVGDAVVTKRTGTPAGDALSVKYLLKDHLGSTIAVVNDQGVVVQQFIYDPWGKQYNVYSNANLMLAYSSDATTKGYTGHEMVNDFDVIHMGGRTYNPVIGRFMQADPHVQFADNLQSYNRYSYVINNPMKYTDPTGYFLNGLKRFVKKYGGMIVAGIVAYYTFGAVSQILLNSGGVCAISLTTGQAMLAGAISGAAGGFVGGALQTGKLSGAIKGAVTGAIAGAAGGFANAGTVSGWSDAASRVGAAALGGCIAGEVSGGNCSDGARKAAIAQAVTVGMEMYSEHQLSGAPAEGEPVVKVFGEGVHDPKVPNVGQSIEVLKKSEYADLAGTKLTELTSEQATQLLGEYSKEYGFINKGKIFIKNGVVSFGSKTEGNWFLKGLSRVPGMNGMAVFHDKWMANIHATSSLVLIPTIAPAIYATYTGLGVGSYKYYARNLRK